MVDNGEIWCKFIAIVMVYIHWRTPTTHQHQHHHIYNHQHLRLSQWATLRRRSKKSVWNIFVPKWKYICLKLKKCICPKIQIYLSQIKKCICQGWVSGPRCWWAPRRVCERLLSLGRGDRHGEESIGPDVDHVVDDDNDDIGKRQPSRWGYH